MHFRILHKDEWLVAIEKPAGFQVHPPENPAHSLSRNKNCLFLLRKQLEEKLYPVHRLDSATSGVLLFALTPEIARNLQSAFQAQEIQKRYYAVVRGFTPDEGTIDHPLSDLDAREDDETALPAKPSLTQYETLFRTEKEVAVGRYATSRYSLVRVEPKTGRQHQIRRHFAHISHPLIGDTVYGDGKHNRHFRTVLETRALLLKAYSLRLTHPVTSESLFLRCRWGDTWQRVFNFFGACPF
ncbi:MAG: hypothetical protein A2X94_13530 [Bdellovibrionales bacterium GWB1_55_8]|nr:MAG: hypothetical protein A2X94_13530 [Bdellovibrionales bacterium GWB1_55_8]